MIVGSILAKAQHLLTGILNLSFYSKTDFGEELKSSSATVTSLTYFILLLTLLAPFLTYLFKKWAQHGDRVSSFYLILVLTIFK